MVSIRGQQETEQQLAREKERRSTLVNGRSSVLAIWNCQEKTAALVEMTLVNNWIEEKWQRRT